MKIEVYKGADDDWYWRMIGAAGNEIADSGEGYKNKAWALHMADQFAHGDYTTTIVISEERHQ